MHKNILICVGITILFLGLAIQPSIATVQPEKIMVEPNVDGVEGLVAQLRIVINEILQEYGHIPIIKTLCNKIVGILDSIGRLLYCIFLIVITILLFNLFIILSVLFRFNSAWLFWRIFLNLYEIEEYCLPSGSNSPLKSLSNINRIVASDSPTLTGLDECPCMQQ